MLAISRSNEMGLLKIYGDQKNLGSAVARAKAAMRRREQTASDVDAVVSHATSEGPQARGSNQPPRGVVPGSGENYGVPTTRHSDQVCNRSLAFGLMNYGAAFQEKAKRAARKNRQREKSLVRKPSYKRQKRAEKSSSSSSSDDLESEPEQPAPKVLFKKQLESLSAVPSGFRRRFEKSVATLERTPTPRAEHGTRTFPGK